MISVDIGRVMRVGEKELEALEWGGLLHDIGKIGVPDSVLEQAGPADQEERAIMNAHPVIGANIIAPVTKLAPELPIIRHHHEWYNGSGYPDRLIGDEIPKLARILHVADAFEAMTAARPVPHEARSRPSRRWRSCASSPGSSSTPAIVDAFARTHWAAGVQRPRAARRSRGRPCRSSRRRRPDDRRAPADSGRRSRPRRARASSHGPGRAPTARRERRSADPAS